MRRPRLHSDFPVGLVVVASFALVAILFVGLLKLALLLVLLAVAYLFVRRRLRRVRFPWRRA